MALTENTLNIKLLKTKYNKPGLNNHAITRKGVCKKLDHSLNCKLTVVTAPAGYGKTTAVLEWLQNISLPVSWVSLNTKDNDPTTFWRYCFAALETICPAISNDAGYVFKSQELFRSNYHLNILIDSLFALPSDCLFILDDFHLIGNTDILDALSHFISYLPTNMHIILISRTSPPLKFAKLGISEGLVRIEAEDLRFATAEIAQFYSSRGYLLAGDEIQRIESYTEGWAAALVAVGLSLKHRQSTQTIFNSTDNYKKHLETYFEEDVYHTWTEEERDFMEKTSILDRFCSPLCQLVTNNKDAHLLEILKDRNSFLISLDDEGVWFRYHHLFRDFLRKKLKTKHQATVNDLHKRAAAWFEGNGYEGEAIEHYLQGKDFEKATALMEEIGKTLIRRGEYSQILTWIQKLPEKYLSHSAILALILASHYGETGDFLSARKLMDQTAKLLTPETPRNNLLLTDYNLASATLFLKQGDMINMLLALQAAQLSRPDSEMRISYLDFNLYEVSLYRIDAFRFFKKMLLDTPQMYFLAIKIYNGFLDINPGYTPLVEGEVYYECGRLTDALPKLAATVDEALLAQCAGALVPAMIAIAKIKRLDGDVDGGLRVVEECERMIAGFKKPHWNYILNAFKVRLYIDMDDSQMVDKWLQENRLNLYEEITKPKEHGFIIFARALIYKKRYKDAHILLNRLLSFAEKHNRFYSIAEINNLLAVAAMLNFEEERALKYLEKSLAIGIEEGLVMCFVEELSPMVSLLEMYLGNDQSTSPDDKLTAFAGELLSRARSAVKQAVFPLSANKIETALTPTEKRVLQMMVKAYTNQDIAEELGITIRTVKAHTGSIYQKLGVKNRVQCVKKANLLSDTACG